MLVSVTRYSSVLQACHPVREHKTHCVTSPIPVTDSNLSKWTFADNPQHKNVFFWSVWEHLQITITFRKAWEYHSNQQSLNLCFWLSIISYSECDVCTFLYRINHTTASPTGEINENTSLSNSSAYIMHFICSVSPVLWNLGWHL